jgi:hypothetical protein
MIRFLLCTIVLVMFGCGAQLGDPVNSSTGSGSDDSPPSGVTTLPDAAPAPTPLDKCCHDRAHCVASTQIPTASQLFLDTDSCADDQLCVPDQILDQDPIAACTATTNALGDYTGVCLDDCFHFGITQLAIAPGSCDSQFECVPCVVANSPTNAPGCP